MERTPPKQRRRASARKSAAAIGTSEEQSPMPSLNHTQNGYDNDPPPGIFPTNRHDAHLEWTIAQRVFLPALKYIILAVVAGLSWFVLNVVWPWKTGMDDFAKGQAVSMQELRSQQQSIFKEIEAHNQMLIRIDAFTSDMRAAVGRIEGRLSPLAQDVYANAGSPLSPAPRASAAAQRPRAAAHEGWQATPR